MKKVILMLVMLAFTVAGYAGDVNKKVKVSSFNGLDISSYFEVTLEKGAQSSVNITVDEELEPYIIAKVNGNVLYLGLRSEDMPRKLRNNNGNRTLKAHITMPTLRKLDLSGATSFSTNDSFDEKEFEGDFSGASKVKNLSLMVSDAEFDISGACDVNLKIDADKCEFDVSGASMLKLNGSIDYLSMDLSGASKCTMNGESISSKFEVSGASRLDAEEMAVKQLMVDVSGASSTDVYVTESIVLEVSGASSLKYRAAEGVRVTQDEVSKFATVTRK